MQNDKPLTMEELASLRAVAKSVIPMTDDLRVAESSEGLFVANGSNPLTPPQFLLPVFADYIATMNPATVLRLLAAAERSCRSPIATAPTDGTEVIIHDGYDHFQNAAFAHGFWFSNVTGEIIHDPIGWSPIPGEGGV